MAKNKTPEMEKNELQYSLPELHRAKTLVERCVEWGEEIQPDLLLLLLRGLEAKIEYLSEKYDFKIDAEDFFGVGDFMDFIHKKEEVLAKADSGKGDDHDNE